MSILELTKQEICDKLQYEEICSQELRECLQNIQHRMKIPDPPEDRKSDGSPSQSPKGKVKPERQRRIIRTLFIRKIITTDFFDFN